MLYKMLIGTLALGCAIEPAPSEELASKREPVEVCYTFPGLYRIRADTDTAPVLRAKELVDKLMGPYPWHMSSPPGSPSTCSYATCTGTTCPGWACTHNNMIPDQLSGRVATRIVYPDINAEFADPFNNLSELEREEFTLIRLEAAEFTTCEEF